MATLTNQHAAVLGLNDTYQLSAWLFLSLAVLVWFAKPVGPKPISAKEDQYLAELEDLLEEP